MDPRMKLHCYQGIGAVVFLCEHCFGGASILSASSGIFIPFAYSHPEEPATLYDGILGNVSAVTFVPQERHSELDLRTARCATFRVPTPTIIIGPACTPTRPKSSS